MVLVPYREQAETDSAAQLVRLVARLEELLGASHRVVVVEQSDDGERFNRGKVLNVAYHLARRLHGPLDGPEAELVEVKVCISRNVYLTMCVCCLRSREQSLPPARSRPRRGPMLAPFLPKMPRFTT